MKILVVDDSATMRRILVKSLQRVGYTDVVQASDGPQALAACSPEVEFVIADGHMPSLPGADLATAMRQRGVTVPILLVTTRSARDDTSRALQAGASDVIVKPFTPQVLKERIDGLCARRACA